MFVQLTILTVGAIITFVTPYPQAATQAGLKLTPGTTDPGAAGNADPNFPASAYMGKGIDMTSVFPVDVAAV